ncbi:MAG: GNAT family N-acetyltransferase [Bacillota bacterium]
MRLEALTIERLKDFLDYCIKYRFEHDESFLYDSDLEQFEIDENNPTYLLVNDQNELEGVASLMIQPYLTDQKKGRFRIMHVAEPNFEAYKLLNDSIMKHTTGLNHINLFIPEAKIDVREILTRLGYSIDRYSWVLVRDDIEVPAPVFPEGFELRNFRPGKDEWAWIRVRNAAFATLRGSETPSTEEDVAELLKHEDYVEGGMMMLWKGDEPVGVIRAGKETEDDKNYAFIGPLAILPEYHGMGLGKGLLRASLRFSKSVGLPYGMLCVNAENEKAAELYLKEGFTKLAVMVNYRIDFK